MNPEILVFYAYSFFYGENFIGDKTLSNPKAFKKQEKCTNKLLISYELDHALQGYSSLEFRFEMFRKVCVHIFCETIHQIH